MIGACGHELPPPPPGAGRPRKWCSQACSVASRGKRELTSNVYTYDKQRCKDMAALYETLGTLDAVAKFYGLTRERVRQILKRGLKDGITSVQPTLIRTARYEEERAIKAERAAIKAERAAIKAERHDPIRQLYRISRLLGWVPSTKLMQRKIRGPLRSMHERIWHSGNSVAQVIREVSEVTGLPIKFSSYYRSNATAELAGRRTSEYKQRAKHV